MTVCDYWAPGVKVTGIHELVANAIADLPLPEWSRWFDIRRYEDAAYVAEIATTEDSGQL